MQTPEVQQVQYNNLMSKSQCTKGLPDGEGGKGSKPESSPIQANKSDEEQAENRKQTKQTRSWKAVL